MKIQRALVLIALTLSSSFLVGCLTNNTLRHDIARRIAGPVQLIKRETLSGPFVLTLYERVHDRGGSAHVYIEGDDVTTGIDPTPENPIGLHLASRDKHANVIYIARPCQYSQRAHTWKETPLEDEHCDFKYSTTHRFAPEVIAAYDELLDELKTRWGFSRFHVYGHSGGGAIAALLASERRDIVSLTTVAGNLDHVAYADYLTQIHYNDQFKPLDGSLNPVDIAGTLASLPQYHYIGADDEVMPPAVLNSYLAAIGNTNCVQFDVIQEAGYNNGWTDKWPMFLKRKPTCRGPIKPVYFDLDLWTPDNS